MTSKDKPTTLSQALSFLEGNVRPIERVALLPYSQAIDHILAETLTATVSLPRFDNSAMDGFAVRDADFGDSNERRFRLAKAIVAGEIDVPVLHPGDASRITTGAKVPSGADRVIMQEHALISTESVVLTRMSGKKSNIRAAGEDVQKGDTVLRAGTRTTAGHIALIAALGIPYLKVLDKPRVALLSTGNELFDLPHLLAPGQIHDTNRPMLRQMLQDAGVHVTDLGIVADDPTAIVSILAYAAKSHDLIVTSGGASAGFADHLARAIQEKGTLEFWKLDMRPGKPIGFGEINGIPILVLPGNPVAAAAGFAIIGRTIIARLAGAGGVASKRSMLPFTTWYQKPAGRTQLLMAQVMTQCDGRGPTISPLAQQGSANYVALANAQVIAILGPEQTEVLPGDLVEIEPLWQTISELLPS